MRRDDKDTALGGRERGSLILSLVVQPAPWEKKRPFAFAEQAREPFELQVSNMVLPQPLETKTP